MTPAASTPIEEFRDQLGRRIRKTLSGSTELAPRSASVEDDPGLFGPGSAAWSVHADPALIIGGLRALLLQTLHPLAMAGVADHSNYRHDPLGRLHRTAAFVGTTTFGTTAEAERSITIVRKVHDRVVGTTPDGRPYEANDPRLLSWVHCTEVDSFLRARLRYGTPGLPADMCDRYVADMAVIAEALGVISPPRDQAELRIELQSFRSQLSVGHQARETVRFLAWPPLPLSTRPTYGIVFTAAVSMLPAFARRMLWMPVAPLVEPLAIRPAATLLMRTLGWALGQHPTLADGR